MKKAESNKENISKYMYRDPIKKNIYPVTFPKIPLFTCAHLQYILKKRKASCSDIVIYFNRQLTDFMSQTLLYEINFLCENKILYNYQFGFRSKHST